MRLYNEIDEGGNDSKRLAKKNQKIGISSINYGLAAIAQLFEDFHHSTKHEADFEIVLYATKHNALAILSDDTDFLIFSGPWRLWSAHGVHIAEPMQLRTTEIDRMKFKRALKLTTEQLPLFASLYGNDITQSLSTELNRFFAPKDSEKFKNFYKVAQFVRKMGRKYDISQIVLKFFGTTDNDKVKKLI